MANFTRANPLGWAPNEVLTSAQMNLIDTQLEMAANFSGGSTHTPTAPVIIDGTQGMEFPGDLKITSGGNLIAENGGEIQLLSGGWIDAESGSEINVKTGADLDVAGEINIQSGGDLDIESGGEINLESGSWMDVNSGSHVYVNSGGEIDLQSGGRIDVNSGGILRLNSGGSLDVNSGSNLDVQTGGEINVLSSGSLDIKSGAAIDLNGSNMTLRAPVVSSTEGRVVQRLLLLGNYDLAVDITDGDFFLMPSSTLTATRTVTLGTASAVDGDTVECSSLDSTASFSLIFNGYTHTRKTGQRYYSKWMFSSGTWYLVAESVTP